MALQRYIVRMLNVLQVERLLRYLGEISAVQSFLSTARSHQLASKQAMTQEALDAQEAMTQLLRGELHVHCTDGAAEGTWAGVAAIGLQARSVIPCALGLPARAAGTVASYG